MDLGHTWCNEPKLLEAMKNKEPLIPWSETSKREPPLLNAAKLPVQPSTPIPIAVGWREKYQMEREAALFMDGKSWKGDWVLHQRTTGEVETFNRFRGRGYIREDRTGDRVFVSRRSFRRGNLYPGEKVAFTKAMGPKGYWAAGLTHLSNFIPYHVGESWDDEKPARPSTPVACERSAKSTAAHTDPELPVPTRAPVVVPCSPVITKPYGWLLRSAPLSWPGLGGAVASRPPPPPPQ